MPKNCLLLNCGVGGLLRVPWTARRSNQSILKEISPGCSLEGLMLKLKLQYFGHLMGRTDSFEKPLILGGIEGRRRRGRQRMRRLDGIINSMDMSCFFFKYNFHFIVFSEKLIFLQSLRTWILTWALVEDMGQPPGLNGGRGVRSFQDSQERLLTTLL